MGQPTGQPTRRRDGLQFSARLLMAGHPGPTHFATPNLIAWLVFQL